MRPMRASALVALVALFAVSVTAAADGKKKPVRCKAGQVRVKAGKKKARCRPLKAVLPKPRSADPRLAFIQTALNIPVPKGHRGGKRRAKQLRRGFGRSGRKAYKKILRALPKALAKVDAKAPARAPLARAAQASDPCGGDGTPLGSSTTSDGGVIMTSDFTSSGMGMRIVFATGGYSFVVEYFTSQGCNDFDVPACPSASGAADADSDRLDRVRVEVRRQGQLISSQRSTVRRQTKAHGQTAADALLDFVDVDDSVAMNMTANGVALNGRLTRHTHINMRTDSYDPSRSNASFAGAQALQQTDNNSFAALAAGIIAVYHNAETNPGRIGFGAGWAVFDRPDGGNYCISGKYDPEISTLRLRKGQSGTFNAKAIAKDGGVAADGHWTPIEQNNATFSEGSGGSPTISYHVGSPRVDERVSVKLKITSTAGVNESTWGQDVEETPINHIRGGFSGSQTQATSLGPSVLSITGNAAFDRSLSSHVGGPANGTFRLASGGYTLVASGIEGSGITGCHQTGSHTFTLTAGQGSVQVDGTGPNRVPPYTYSWGAGAGPQSFMATRVDCPEGAKDYEGTKFQTGLYTSMETQQTHPSADGRSYTGSEDQTFMGSGLRLSWGFQGTED